MGYSAAASLDDVPDSSVSIEDPATARQILRLCDALEDCEDVLNVHSNFEIPDEILAEAQEELKLS